MYAKPVLSASLTPRALRSLHGRDFRNLGSPESFCQTVLVAHFPQPQRNVRAPRVCISQSVPVLLMTENQRIPGNLQSLSLTGGAASFARPCPVGALVELCLGTPLGPLNGLAEVLPTAANCQPFRFVAMSDNDHERLCRTVLRSRHGGGPEPAPARF